MTERIDVTHGGRVLLLMEGRADDRRARECLLHRRAGSPDDIAPADDLRPDVALQLGRRAGFHRTSPIRVIACRVSGIAMMAFNSACSLSTTGFGRRRRRDHHLPRRGFEGRARRARRSRNLGRDIGAIFLVVTQARGSCPPGSTADGGESVIITCSSPPIRSTCAATARLVGDMHHLMPVMLLNSSA